MPPRRKAQPVFKHDEDMTSADNNPPQPPAKKRGRPPKADDVAATTETADLSTAPAPSKRKRGQTITTNNEGDIPAPKRTRAGATKTMGNPATKLTTKTSAQPIANRNLPQREGRNVHPGAVKGVGPAVRRSSQQVAAERDATKKAAEEKLQKIDGAKAHLAEMHIAEELEDEEMQADNFIVRNEQQAGSGDSDDGEHFDFNDAGLTDDEEEESNAGKKPATKVCQLNLLLIQLSNLPLLLGAGEKDCWKALKKERRAS